MILHAIRPNLRADVIVAILVAACAALPGPIPAQSSVPSAEELHEALQTLRRLERALAAEPVVPEARAPLDRPGDYATHGPGAAASTSTALGSARSQAIVALPASFSLSLSGDLRLDGAMFKDGGSFIHNDGGSANGNTAVGWEALMSATPGSPSSFNGGANSAIGQGALRNNTSGFRNTATGVLALYDNTEGAVNTATGALALRHNKGPRNTGTGAFALFSNTLGGGNTASGAYALFYNIDGSLNTGIGYRALQNSTGSSNSAVGQRAGYNWTVGNDNIALGKGSNGEMADSGVIRIGGGNFQTKTFIEGIAAATGTFAAGVCISGDQLGPCSASSQRFKQEIETLDGTHHQLSALRPVSFRYRAEFSGEKDPVLRYGLIAEEVAEALPSLVTYDDEGKPHTVRYDLLTPLLLGEIQMLEREIERLRRQMADRDEVLLDLRRSVADQVVRLDKLAKQKRFRVTSTPRRIIKIGAGKRKALERTRGPFKLLPGGDLLSHTVARAVPSARKSLTAVFGMGTGVSSSP